jgi:hypothetical protein
MAVSEFDDKERHRRGTEARQSGRMLPKSGARARLKIGGNPGPSAAQLPRL